MKIVYQDLIEFLSDKPSKEELSEKLFQLGHEHEVDGDIFNMELTPNRGDCLSLIGLARDLNIFFGSTNFTNLFKEDLDSLEINFKNLAPKDCPKISFLEIEIEDNNTSNYKPYLENYFNSVGGNKTNLFTDISNYISYESGQPTHCFDSDTLHDDLVFENKYCNNSFKTLLGSEIRLIDHNCVFSVGNKIVLPTEIGNTNNSNSFLQRNYNLKNNEDLILEDLVSGSAISKMYQSKTNLKYTK